MMTLRYEPVWKWALALILCLVAIFGVFAFEQQETSNQYWAVRSERTAGLAAVSSIAALPRGLASEQSVALQAASSGPMIIRTVSLRLTFAHPDTLLPRVD